MPSFVKRRQSSGARREMQKTTRITRTPDVMGSPAWRTADGWMTTEPSPPRTTRPVRSKRVPPPSNASLSPMFTDTSPPSTCVGSDAASPASWT